MLPHVKWVGRILVLLLVGGVAGWAIHRNYGRPHATAALAALDRVFPVVRFRDARLEDVLRDFEAKAGMPIDVNWDAALSDGIIPTSLVTLHRYDITLQDALAMLFHVKPQAIRAGDGRITVADDSRPPAGPVYVTTYDVGDLLDAAELTSPYPRGPTFKIVYGILIIPKNRREELALFIQEAVDSESWIRHGGSVGAIRFAGDSMVVVQNAANHEQLAVLLAQVREATTAKRDEVARMVREAPRLKQLLGKKLDGTLTVDGRLADDALDSIRAAFRANVTFNERAWEKWETRLSTRVTLRLSNPTLGQALNAWARQVGMAPDEIWLLEENSDDFADGIGGSSGGVLISSAAEEQRKIATEVYDFQPLVRAGTPDVVRTVRNWIVDANPEAAREADYSKILRVDRSGIAVVTQSRGDHRLLRRWLDERLAEKAAAATKPAEQGKGQWDASESFSR